LRPSKKRRGVEGIKEKAVGSESCSLLARAGSIPFSKEKRARTKEKGGSEWLSGLRTEAQQLLRLFPVFTQRAVLPEDA
jgi:hypothetical protein